MDERPPENSAASPVQQSPAPQSTVPQSPARYTIFTGPNGLRAGWRLAIFAAIIGTPYVFLMWVGRMMMKGLPAPKPGPISPLTIGFGELMTFGFIVLVTGLMGLMENRSYAHFGLPWRTPFPRHFWVGLLWGFVSISALMAGIAAGHGFHIDGLATHGSAALLSGAGWALAFLFVGLFEEFFFRGYLLFTLTTGIGFWPSAVICAAFFAYAHTGNSGETPFGIAQVALFGLFACLALRRTGNLWWPIGFHAAWDWGQTYFYGVPDSGLPASSALLRTHFHGPNWLTGGPTGPEASIFSLVVLILATALVAWNYRGVKYPDPDALGPRPRSQVQRNGSLTQAA
jgi:uncharacterized protein